MVCINGTNYHRNLFINIKIFYIMIANFVTLLNGLKMIRCIAKKNGPNGPPCVEVAHLHLVTAEALKRGLTTNSVFRTDSCVSRFERVIVPAAPFAAVVEPFAAIRRVVARLPA